MRTNGPVLRRERREPDGDGGLRLGPTDRVLVLAAHPDDESLATGGLIQAALAAGGEVRVLYLTDGDFNPWAQLVVEGRWPLTAADRARWSARRRGETLRALACLGLPARCVTRLGYPDQGLSALLLRGDEDVIEDLMGEIRSFRPTLVAGPSPDDRHPDHNALAVMLEIAIERVPSARSAVRVLHYVLHGGADVPAPGLQVTLDRRRQERKREAILCHTSQLRWHRRAMLGRVGAHEGFDDATAARPHPRHPVRRAALEGGLLVVDLARLPRPGWGPVLLRATLSDPAVRLTHLTATWPARPGAAPVHETATGRPWARATLDRIAEGWRLTVPLEDAGATRIGFVKLDRPWERALGFFDRSGWCPATATRRATDSRGRLGRDVSGERARAGLAPLPDEVETPRH